MKNLSLEKITLWSAIISLWTFLFLLSNGAFAQTNWTNIGNGLQTRVVSGFREYRFTAITGYQPFNITDSLKTKLTTPTLTNSVVIGTNMGTSDVGLVGYSQTPMGDQLAMYNFGGQLSTADPVDPTDAVNKQVMEDSLVLKAPINNPLFTGNIGLNEDAPESSFHIGDGNAIILDRYKNGTPAIAPNFLGRAFGGTKLLPTAVLDGQRTVVFGGIGYDGTDAETATGWVQFTANGDQTPTNKGTGVDIYITKANDGINPRNILSGTAERLLLASANATNAPPVAIGYYGKDGITGENPHKLQVISDGLNPTVSMGNFGGATAGNAGGHLWSARGTAESPTAIVSGDYLWSWGFRGQGATTRAPSSANMSVRATENFTDTSHGTEIRFGTNATGHDANLGRTSEFIMQEDGGFYQPYSKVQSYAGGQLGSYRFNYMANAASRSWIIANDYNAFGDLAILQSTTQTGDTYALKLYITTTGEVQSNSDVEVTDNTKGIILKSPDGTRYRVTVANGGTLTVTAL